MSFAEFLSPILRRKGWFFGLWIGLALVLFGVYLLLPSVTKSTIYFTISPVGSPEKTLLLPGVEDAEKVAEMVSGWAKDPGFRTQILSRAGVAIPNFKRKLSARKQNRLNVFWTIKLSGDQQKFSTKIADATVDVLTENFTAFNERNSFSFEMTSPRISHEPWRVPFLWALMGSIIVAGMLAGVSIYSFESLTGRISFLPLLYEMFPEAPILRIYEKPGSHDERLLEQFILTFDSPRLVGTFPGADRFFSIAPTDSIDEERDTPVFLVKLGTTRIRELENLVAIFGDDVGVIVFEK